MLLAKILLCLTAVLTTLPAAISAADAPGKVIYTEDFSSVGDGTPLSKLGWRIVSSPEQSTYEVRNGRLRVTCRPVRLNGGFAEARVPLCRKGMLEFDACIASEGAGNAKGMGLTLDIYNISTFWHDYCKDWRRYFPEPVARRMDGFNVEPVGHKSITPVDKGRWHHYRILFDTDGDTVEYYIDGAQDPAYIDGSVPVLGRCEYQGGYLRVGNLGVMNGPVVCELDNFRLTDLDGVKAGNGDVDRHLYLVFNGMSFDKYDIGGALQASGMDAKDIRAYTLDFWRAAPYPENFFKLDGLPGSASLAAARAIILADMPAGPGEVLPGFILERIAESVYDGAHLVVFGGLFTLEKGEFQGTPLEGILPVKLGGRWSVRTVKQPLPISPLSGTMPGNPAVYSYHALELQPDAEVLMRAGDVPLLVSRKFGRGRVTVWLGTVCGREQLQAPLFWKWPGWPQLVKSIIAGKATTG